MLTRMALLASLLLTTMSAKAGALEIVLPENPTFFETKAAEEAQALCGKVKSLGKLHLGRAALSTALVRQKLLDRLKTDGFVVASDGTEVAICGKPGAGVLYGVYALFRRLGGEIYAHDKFRLPNEDTILKAFSFARNPAFALRRLDYNFYYWPKKMQNVNSTRLGFSPDFKEDKVAAMGNTAWYDPKSTSGYEHTNGSLCPTRLYLKEHPEFFARDDEGKALNDEKTRDTFVHLCLANREMRKVARERFRKWLESCPNSSYFQIGEGDSHSWCRCPACRKLDPKGVRCFDVEYPFGKFPAHLADRMLNYANDLAAVAAKDYPDKKLMVLAYQATSQIPLREKPADNVLMLLCAGPMAGNLCSGHSECPQNVKYWKLYRDWKAAVGPKKMAIYEYAINYKNIYTPFFSLDGLTTRIKRYNKDGIENIGFNGHPYLFAELYHYLLGKLLWQPNLNPRKLEHEFLDVYYGPASDQMARMLALLRKCLRNPNKEPHQQIFPVASPLINAKYCASAYGIFSAAEKAAANNPEILWRVRYAKLCAVLWGDLDQMKNPDPTAKLKEMAAICRAAPDPKMVYHLTSNTGITFEQWSQERFGFTLNEKTWLDDPRFK